MPAAVLLIILLTVIAVNHCSSSEALGGNKDTVITIHAGFYADFFTVAVYRPKR